MNLSISIRGTEEEGVLRRHAERKIGTGLKRFESRISRAEVRLEDETGPNKRRVDKVCVIALHVGQRVIRVRQVGDDFRSVIDLALDRARGALTRQLNRVKRGVGEG